MQSPDPVQVTRALFEAFRRGDGPALARMAHPELELGRGSFQAGSGHDALGEDVEGTGAADPLVEVTPHTFEQVGPEQVLVSGRRRVFGRGLRDSPAWWLMTIRDGLWVGGRTFSSEHDARAACVDAAPA